MLLLGRAVPLVLLVRGVYSSSSSSLNVDADLNSFISRPDIRAPKLNVTVYEPALQNPGHFMIAAYGDLIERRPSLLYSPHQTGPHIYDSTGDLIWSGGHLFHNERPVFDFKKVSGNGVNQFSMILMARPQDSQYRQGAGLLLDSSFRVTQEIQTYGDNEAYYGNMHEFNIVNGGQSALFIVGKPEIKEISKGEKGISQVLVLNQGFLERDLASRKILFEWWALNHIDIEESDRKVPNSSNVAWDWLHLNSIDKDSNGDYLISGRYTSTIYKISGKDGTILWRLGGKNSSFHMENFNFSYQHDARFQSVIRSNLSIQDSINQLKHDETGISLLDNGVANIISSDYTSRGLLLALDEDAKIARVIKSYSRPDGRATPLRGSMQLLPDNNALLCWSSEAYMSEFDPSGKHVLDARFTSSRFVTYRGYKFEFEGLPTDPPDLKGFAYGPQNRAPSISVWYISWNGATNVKEWRFYGVQARPNVKKSISKRTKTGISGNDPRDEFVYLGKASKESFETMFTVSGFIDHCYAEAVANNGSILGRSRIVRVNHPSGWMLDAESSLTKETEHYSRTSQTMRCFNNFLRLESIAISWALQVWNSFSKPFR